jgi:anti-anti-sigma regulatory factor
VLAVPEVPLTWQLADKNEPAVLSVRGSLNVASGEALHRAMTTALRRGPGQLLIDISAMTVIAADAVRVFARIMEEALRWPAVLALICAPAVEVAALLTAEVLDPRLLFGSVAAGRSAVLSVVPPVSQELSPVFGAARQARDVITDACLRWDEPDLVAPATVVVSELVTNASVHADTTMTLHAQLRQCHLHLAVVDGSRHHAVRRQASADRPGGRGMNLVDAFSAAWGSTLLPTGKVVWSALARPPRDH